MIVPIIREIVTTDSPNYVGIPFGHGRDRLKNIEQDVYPSAWLYPVVEMDDITGQGAIKTKYLCIMDFHVRGDLEPGALVEEGYISQSREMALKFEQKLNKDSRVEKVEGIKREPLYNFLAANLYGYAVQFTVTLKAPYSVCLP